MLVTSLCDLQIGKMSSGCNKTLCLRQWQCINIRKDHFLISFKCCIYRIQYFIICRRSKYFVYFRYFFQNFIFITLCHAPRHDQCFYFSFFFQFCHLKDILNTFFLGIMNKAAGIDHDNIRFLLIICHLISSGCQ